MKISNIMWGVVLIVIGIIFGLNSLGVTNINLFFNGWWCFFIIIPSFIDLFKDNDKTGSIIGLIIGISLLLASNDIINFKLIWKLIIPVILVIVGLSFIFKDVLSKKVKKEIKKLNINKDKETYALFGGQTLNYSDEEFSGNNINSIFAGIKCDLRNSIINDDVVINAMCIFGGITIFVPNDVKVVINSTPIFGGVGDERRKKNKDAKKILYINATCIFGGIEIK